MKLNILTVVSDDIKEVWETHVLLSSLVEYEYDKLTHILIFQRKERFLEEFNKGWEELEKKFPNVKFVYFKDFHNITRICQIFHYFPLFRLYVLQEYFKLHPELEQEAIFYIDADILITKPLPFDKWLEDDINYLSWTGNKERTDNYLWQPYWDGKVEQVLPERLEQWKKLDVFNKACEICSTNREEVTKNSPNIGGAQYLLKNINSQFWTDCFNSCCELKLYLENMNQLFFKGESHTERENKGIQSFCSDMWVILFQLIGKGREVKTPKELDFAWSCERKERLEDVGLLHNAGILSDAKFRVAFEKLPDGTNKQIEGKAFFKGAWLDKSPLDYKEQMLEIYNDPINKQFVNNAYVAQILKIINNE